MINSQRFERKLQSAVNWISDELLSMQILTVNEAIVPKSSHSSEAVDPLRSAVTRLAVQRFCLSLTRSEGEVSIVGESNGRLVKLETQESAYKQPCFSSLWQKLNHQ